MAYEFLALAVLVVTAANAFLYYRWKELKEALGEKQHGDRVGFAKEMLNTFYGTKENFEEHSLLAQARQSSKELKELLEGEIVEIHQKLVSTEQKLSAKQTAS